MQILRTITNGILDILYPNTCPMCHCALPSDEVLCEACIAALPRTEQHFLRGNSTEELFSSRKRFVRGGAFLFFEKGAPVQDLILKMKFGHAPEIGYFLAQLAAKEWKYAYFQAGVDVIIPIPLHPKRIRERGYNQSYYIAKGLSEAWDIPVDTEHVYRTLNNDHQASKRGKDRYTNVKGIFAVTHPEDLYRKHILLVDDVITTGSTVNECIKTLSVCRGAKISVFAIGKARS